MQFKSVKNVPPQKYNFFYKAFTLIDICTKSMVAEFQLHRSMKCVVSE